jgi:hypothetical protein
LDEGAALAVEWAGLEEDPAVRVVPAEAPIRLARAAVPAEAVDLEEGVDPVKAGLAVGAGLGVVVVAAVAERVVGHAIALR